MYISVRGFLVGVLMASLSGCAATPWVPPNPETVPPNSARVRFALGPQMKGYSASAVREYETAGCEGESELGYLLPGKVFGQELRRLGIPLWDFKRNGAMEIYVPGGTTKVYTITNESFSTTMGTRGCAARIEHRFEAGKDYEISYRGATVDEQWNGAAICTIDLFEIVSDESGAERVLIMPSGDSLTREEAAGCRKAVEKIRFF